MSHPHDQQQQQQPFQHWPAAQQMAMAQQVPPPDEHVANQHHQQAQQAAVAAFGSPHQQEQHVVYDAAAAAAAAASPGNPHGYYLYGIPPSPDEQAALAQAHHHHHHQQHAMMQWQHQQRMAAMYAQQQQQHQIYQQQQQFYQHPHSSMAVAAIAANNADANAGATNYQQPQLSGGPQQPMQHFVHHDHQALRPEMMQPRLAPKDEATTKEGGSGSRGGVSPTEEKEKEEQVTPRPPASPTSPRQSQQRPSSAEQRATVPQAQERDRETEVEVVPEPATDPEPDREAEGGQPPEQAKATEPAQDQSGRNQRVELSAGKAGDDDDDDETITLSDSDGDIDASGAPATTAAAISTSHPPVEESTHDDQQLSMLQLLQRLAEEEKDDEDKEERKSRKRGRGDVVGTLPPDFLCGSGTSSTDDANKGQQRAKRRKFCVLRIPYNEKWKAGERFRLSIPAAAMDDDDGKTGDEGCDRGGAVATTLKTTLRTMNKEAYSYVFDDEDDVSEKLSFGVTCPVSLPSHGAATRSLLVVLPDPPRSPPRVVEEEVTPLPPDWYYRGDTLARMGYPFYDSYGRIIEDRENYFNGKYIVI